MDLWDRRSVLTGLGAAGNCLWLPPSADAVGEQFGYKWDINTLIEGELIDYTRVTLPNAGGITELMKIVALAETH